MPASGQRKRKIKGGRNLSKSPESKDNLEQGSTASNLPATESHQENTESRNVERSGEENPTTISSSSPTLYIRFRGQVPYRGPVYHIKLVPIHSGVRTRARMLRALRDLSPPDSRPLFWRGPRTPSNSPPMLRRGPRTPSSSPPVARRAG